MTITSDGHSHHPTQSFDLEDAFNDRDDDQDFHFSSDAVRQEMAQNLTSWSNNVENETSHDSFRQPDSSVSTLDFYGDERSSPPPGVPNDEDNPAQFVQISLSNSGPDVVQAPKYHTGTEEDTKQSEVARTVVASEQDSQTYPAVHIDMSKPPAHRVTLSTDSTGREEDGACSRDVGSTLPSIPYRADHDKTLVASAPNLPSIPLNTTAHPSSMSPTSVKSTLQPPPSKPIDRYIGSIGPSMFEKVRSRTRPSFLPPKPREEDDKHMADWRTMMKQSRAMAEKKRKALEERRMAREKKIEDSLHFWEKEIVPDWKIVLTDPAMHKVWWRGIPTKLRASMWERAVGNPLALSKDNYRSCLARAKKALNAGTFPAATLTIIEEDILSTLPALHIFHRETGPLYSDLKEMLCAWVVARSDEGLGYVFGASKIAAMFLLNMPIQQGFVVMRNLLERHCMRSFFGGDGAKDEVEAYYRIFDTLLADGMPKIYFNFKQHQISPSAYLPDWLTALFLNHLPLEACARIWDVLMLEGDSFLYRASLGILAVLEPRLFFPDRKELIELLKGENKAAIEVAKREGQSLIGGKYEIYGVNEETLWDRIEGMEDWWRESTWNRLIQRELPDR
ncbi:hypothetical protein E1B28_001467 [Marasmius oreades]|uniref:Rab-GAP TBC domain-containing protein n=1 Tax=Marasmius oreades TaxID=181124 RepID=A0A9P8AF71_9AGAR|nr:uncharacterized protein E1B28_001467 [Marasmius oreades]KAG7099641.1 hypothetical protein E1B28_001467 [Marasmius oreades]